MPSFPRASVHVLVALALTACVVVTPFRGDERAEALPTVPAGMHEVDCRSTSSGTTDHPAHAGMTDPSAHGGMLMPTAAACAAFRPAISLKGWTAAATSSAKGHPAGAALTGGSRTWWQTISRAGGFRSQTLTVRTRAAKTISGLRYAPAAKGGSIGRFEIRLSTDGRRFGGVVASGRWQRDSVSRQVGWTPRKIRAIKITIRSVSPARQKRVTAATITLTGVKSGSTTQQPPTQAPAPVPTIGAPASPEPTNPFAPLADASPSSAVTGRWGPTIGFPLVPVAVAAIPGNRLVVWAAEASMAFDTGDNTSTQTAVLNLTTGAVSASRVSNTGHDMFCPGISLLADGRVLVSGGISNTQTSIYDPDTDQWSAGPWMNVGRGYNSQTTLSNGKALTVGGSWSGPLGGKVCEVYTPGGTWRALPRVATDAMLTADAGGIYRSDNHPWLIAASQGTVLQAGPSKQMNWISTDGDGAVTPAGARADAGDQMNGNAVLFDVNKVLTVGGATSYQDVDATGTADVLDLSGGYGKPVRATATGSLTHPRSYANSVVLPDGGVLTIGGMAHPVPFSDAGSVLTPELWNPATGTWSEMADAAEPRNYHSVTALLPDGTVFSGGGGLCGASCSTNHPTGQVFSPPYLFQADGSPAVRPTISDVPASAAPGQDITVQAAGASRFVLIRAGSSTHSVDTDQRRVPLVERSRDGGAVTLAIPEDNGVVLPGRYMLFALTDGGVPSVSAPITIGIKG